MKAPYEQETELTVLGSILMSPECFGDISRDLTVDDFYLTDCRNLFEAFSAINKAGNEISVPLVNVELERLGGETKLDKPIGETTLGDALFDSAANNDLSGYVTILNEFKTRRILFDEAVKWMDAAHDRGQYKADLIALGDTSVRRLHESQTDSRDPVHILKPLKESIAEIDRRFKNQGELLGYSSGIKALDKRIHGFQDGNLYILAARPAMGKSTIMNVFAKAIADHCPDKPLVIFTLEMPSRQLVERMISMAGQIRGNRLKTGDMRQEDFASLTAAFNALKGLNIYFDDCTGQTIYDMSAKAKKLHRDHGGLAGIMVDHIGLIAATNARQQTRERIGEASRYGKELAKDLSCPVFYLSQLNRSVDSRPDKRPTMSDLRESGDLEQDADGIFMLYRDDYYNPDSVHKNTIEINTVKSREGETGSDVVGINLAESRVYEIDFSAQG